MFTSGGWPYYQVYLTCKAKRYIVEPNQWMYIIYHINSIVFAFKTGEFFLFIVWHPLKISLSIILTQQYISNHLTTKVSLKAFPIYHVSICKQSSSIASRITTPWLAKDRFSGFWRRVGTWQTPEIFQNFINIYFIMIVTTVIWLKYCWYGVHNSTNAQSTYLATPLCL